MNSTLRAIGYLPREGRDAIRDWMRWQDIGEGRDSIEFDVAEALYWVSVDCHDGQFSDLYRMGCILEFQPGPLSNGPEPDTSAMELYEYVVDALGFDSDD